MMTTLKKNPAIVPLLAIAACTLLVLLCGCTGKSADFSIDNPTEAPLNVRIDQTDHAIAPRSAQDVTLPAGRHTIEAPALGKLDFIVYAQGRGGVINPTLSPYIIINEVYARDDAAAKGFKPMHKTIQLDGVSFTGPFQVNDQLFIEKSWQYGVHEDFPASITSRDNNSKGNIHGKLFSKDEFVAYVEAAQDQPGRYAEHRSTVPAPKPNPVPAPVVLPVFADPQLEAVALKMKALYAAYEKAEDPDEQVRLSKSSHDLFMEFVKLQAPKAYKAPKEENEKYNTLVFALSDLLSRSARVVAKR